MILGGLLDLGVPQNALEKHFKSIGLEPFRIVSSLGERAHLRGTHVRVEAEGAPATERTFREIKNLIEKSSLKKTVRQSGVETFRRLAEVEGRIHQEPPEEVHFHEIGALDSIVDILGVFVGIDYLEIDAVYASRIPLGKGMIESRHGMLPVPVPATVELLKGVPVYDSNIEGELVTPTGAACLTTLTSHFGQFPEMEIERVGYGLGDRNLGDIPNALRIVLGRAKTSLSQDRVMLVETDIDDMNPEFFEPLMDRLFASGALDVSFIAIQRKKNRPGITVRTICEESDRGKVVETILEESTSIGVRYFPVQREKLARRIQRVETPFGEVRVKISQSKEGRIHHVSPEYEDCRRLGLKTTTPIMEVYQEAVLAARRAKMKS